MAADDDTADASADPTGGIPPGLEPLQQAALEAVRAARSLLDAAESVLRDPAALDSVVRTAAGVARAATETVAGFAGAANRAASGTPGSDPDGAAPDDDFSDDDTGYQDIAVG